MNNKFINELDQIIHWPKKPIEKQNVMEWLSKRFEFDKEYSETEINIVIDEFHCFNDIALLRRELISRKFLDRENDGSKYWRIN